MTCEVVDQSPRIPWSWAARIKRSVVPHSAETTTMAGFCASSKISAIRSTSDRHAGTSRQTCDFRDPHASWKPPRTIKSPTTNNAMASTTATALGPSTGSWRPLTSNGSCWLVLRFNVVWDWGMLDGGLNATRTLTVDLLTDRPKHRRVGPRGEPVARLSHPMGCCGRCRASSGPQTHGQIPPLVRREWPSWPSPWRAPIHQTMAHQGPEGGLNGQVDLGNRLNLRSRRVGRPAQPFALRPLGPCIGAVDMFRWPSEGDNRSTGRLPRLPRHPGGPPPACRALQPPTDNGGNSHQGGGHAGAGGAPSSEVRLAVGALHHHHVLMARTRMVGQETVIAGACI